MARREMSHYIIESEYVTFYFLEKIFSKQEAPLSLAICLALPQN